MKKIQLIIVVLFVSIGINAQQDCRGCKDYVVLPRMPDFYIEKLEEVVFDSQEFYFDSRKLIVEGKKMNRRVELVLK